MTITVSLGANEYDLNTGTDLHRFPRLEDLTRGHAFFLTYGHDYISLAKGQELACKMKEGWVWEQMFLMLQEMKM